MNDWISLLPDIDTHGVKYLGSKKKILSQIGNMLFELGVTSAIDVFSGTTRVAQYFRQRRISMVTSDLAWATTCYAHTYVHNQDNRHLQDCIDTMNRLPPVHGWLSQNYTGDAPQTAQRGDGRCFQLKNAMKADAARDWIDTQPLALWERMTLITSVIHALDAVDNTVGVQQAYLKEWCTRSCNDIVFKLPASINGPVGEHLVGDALKLDYPVSDLAYLDPPYSSHSYATYYHIWDSIAKWDKPETDLKARRRVDRVAKRPEYDDLMESPWNRTKDVVIDAFDALLARLPVRYLLISYNDESIVSQKELEEVCRRYGSVQTNYIDYNRNIMSQVGNAAKDGRDVRKKQRNYELLFLVDKQH